jgi:RNA polymerase sigma-70 factor (ECF subfamily)
MKRLIQLSDQELINLYLGGDSQAFSALVIRYKSKLYTSIYLLLKDRSQTEDMFQDLLIRVIDKLKKGLYKEEGKFLPWMIRIAHNMCLDQFRKVKRLPIIKMSNEADFFEQYDLASPDIETNMINKETSIQVTEMLDMLPDEQREIIILRHYADLTFKEIAALKHISINTALGRMRYGLMNMRKTMVEKQVVL